MTQLMLTRNRLRQELSQYTDEYHQYCRRSSAASHSAARRRAIEDIEQQIHIAEQYLANLSFLMWDKHKAEIIRHWKALAYAIDGLQLKAA